MIRRLHDTNDLVRAFPRVHFVGIGGTGMSGIAEVMLTLGYEVSGSDNADNVATRRLASLGARIMRGHSAANVLGTDCVVVSSAIREDNPELMEARSQRIPIMPRAAMLAELMRFRRGIAVAGTHGKTTTTSLTAAVLSEGGLDPTFVIGGQLLAAGANAKLGSGQWLVAEADESDGSFLRLNPLMSIITNIDADHLENYGNDFARVQAAFAEFLQRLPFYGLAVLCIDDPEVAALAAKTPRHVMSYGMSPQADVRAENVVQEGSRMRFTLRLPQTLAVTQAVFVQIGETTFAVPVASVSGIGRLSRERFEAADSSYRYSGEDYPLYDLGSLVGQAPARADGQDQVPLLLVRAGDLRAAVAIDQVLGNREIVVKPVGLQIASVPGIYGATITGDGRVVVILDVAPLVRRFLANPTLPVLANAPRQERQVPLVMVVDDSLTMRKVTGRILERHNFEVSVARDGVEALERLEERVPDLMLLDIEMPRMDGYELATAMRADPRYKDVPIVMITSRSGDKHRQRAFEIGVQRYLGKPYQELDLMRNVYDLLGIARVRE